MTNVQDLGTRKVFMASLNHTQTHLLVSASVCFTCESLWHGGNHQNQNPTQVPSKGQLFEKRDVMLDHGLGIFVPVSAEGIGSYHENDIR